MTSIFLKYHQTVDRIIKILCYDVLSLSFFFSNISSISILESKQKKEDMMNTD